MFSHRDTILANFAFNAGLTGEAAKAVPAVLDTAWEKTGKAEFSNFRQFVSVCTNTREIREYLAGVCQEVAS